MTLSITTRETIRFTVGAVRHPGQPQADADACNSCNAEAKATEAALIAHLLKSIPNPANPSLLDRTKAAPKPRGLCRWHPWGCPTDRGYYEGPRTTLAGPALDIYAPKRFVNDDFHDTQDAY